MASAANTAARTAAIGARRRRRAIVAGWLVRSWLVGVDPAARATDTVPMLQCDCRRSRARAEKLYKNIGSANSIKTGLEDQLREMEVMSQRAQTETTQLEKLVKVLRLHKVKQSSNKARAKFNNDFT